MAKTIGLTFPKKSKPKDKEPDNKIIEPKNKD